MAYPTKTGRWGYKIGDRFELKTYPTASEAKLALLRDFWAATGMASGCGAVIGEPGEMRDG